MITLTNNSTYFEKNGDKYVSKGHTFEDDVFVVDDGIFEFHHCIFKKSVFGKIDFLIDCEVKHDIRAKSSLDLDFENKIGGNLYCEEVLKMRENANLFVKSDIVTDVLLLRELSQLGCYGKMVVGYMDNRGVVTGYGNFYSPKKNEVFNLGNISLHGYFIGNSYTYYFNGIETNNIYKREDSPQWWAFDNHLTILNETHTYEEWDNYNFRQMLELLGSKELVDWFKENKDRLFKHKK